MVFLQYKLETWKIIAKTVKMDVSNINALTAENQSRNGTRKDERKLVNK